MFIATLFMGTLSLGSISIDQNTPQTSIRAGLPPAPEEDPDIWTEQLLLLLQIMCVIMQCNPNNTVSGANETVETWVKTYEERGLKFDLGGVSKETALAQIAAMRDKAMKDPGVLAEYRRAAFLNSLYSIETEITQ